MLTIYSSQRMKTTSRRRAVLGTYVFALCFRCGLYARMTGERMQCAYVMRGNQKKHVLHLLPPLFSNWSDLPMPRSSSTLTLLSRMCIFFGPCINRTIKNLRVARFVRIWALAKISTTTPSPLDDGRRGYARTINTSSVRDARKGEKVQRTTNKRRCHPHS